jgi:hypothetical protein
LATYGERETDFMKSIAILDWTGWQRLPRGRWRAVVQTGSEADCWRLLLDQAGGGEKVALLTGQHPWHRRDNPATNARLTTPESE